MISVVPAKRKDWVTSIVGLGWYTVHERGDMEVSEKFKSV